MGIMTMTASARASYYAISRAHIENTVARFVLALDSRDIDSAVACLAPRVRWDYASVTGQPAAEIDASALAARWQSTIVHTDASQHFLSMPCIGLSGDRATCVVHAQVTVRLANRIGSQHLTTHGTYTFGLVRAGADWSIDAVAMAQLWSDGNPRIMELAAAGGVQR
ncbi:nuclear transport factor 2 family protein [Cupriavidus necator]|uniref:Nuclear transport factor 2 family protein n=2 Tax=Cupriavidus necator TaxID=106590 RepID=A0A1U9V143_CUPNE|nr:nuclear transport factor 2 family protein [Cupriavidus necator]